MKYNTVACGGTFDLLHKGHKEFLRFAFSLGEKILIGLTTDAFISQQKQAQQIKNFSARKQALETFLRQENLSNRAIIIPIDTIYGPTLEKDKGIEAIAVTEETEKNAILINEERQKLHLSKLPVYVMPIIRNNGIIISSSNMRNGLIDSEGNIQTLFLPQKLRTVLHKPFGQLLANGIEEIKKIDQNMIVTVGDVTTARFNKEHIGQKISVIDYVVERKKTYQTITELGFTGKEEIVSLKNPAGKITAESWRVINTLTSNFSHQKRNDERFIITVDGEEDLLVIPLILTLPPGFQIFYGQPHEGLVKVQVAQDSKERALELIKQFNSDN